MSMSMKVTGFKDLERALAQLPQAHAKSTVRRAMKAELAPVADTANAFWAGDSGDVFQVRTKLKRGQPQPYKGRSVLNLFVGAVDTPESHLVEWGTAPRFHKSGKFVGQVAPQPALTPAWDMHKQKVLNGLADRIRSEIQRTMERAAKRQAKG